MSSAPGKEAGTSSSSSVDGAGVKDGAEEGVERREGTGVGRLGTSGSRGGFQTWGMFLTALAGTRDEGERARLAVAALPSLIRCRVACVALREGSSGEDPSGVWSLAVEGGGGETSPEPSPELRSRLDRLRDVVLSRGHLLLNPSSEEDAGFELPPPFETLEPGSLAVFSLRTLRKDFGLLLVARDDGDGFAPRDRTVLEVVSQQIAVGLENLRLQESLRDYSEDLNRLVEERTEQLDRSQQRLRVLLEITNAMVGNLDRKALFQVVTESLPHAVDFDRVSLALRETDDPELLNVFSLGAPVGEGEIRPWAQKLRRGDSAFGEVMQSRRPRIRRDLREAGAIHGHEEWVREKGIRSYAMVPLEVRGRVLGAVAMGSETPGRYREEDADFLLQVGRQLALALDNMLAYEEVEELRRQLELENVYLREELQEAQAFGEIIGRSPAIRKIEEQVGQVAPTDATVLVMGESGTGKELVAREIHARSARSDGPMIKVNCAAVPRELYESEFFGHVEGAFSGAVRDRAGRFAAADGGTLFLDEVGEIPPELQSKLLRVLQDGTYQRVGEERTRTVDVRILAATNRDLPEEVREGRFREDLYYRINVFPIHIPPLRVRKEDIPLLAAHFLEEAGRKLDAEELRLTEGDVAELRAYDWPGNVRELRNVIERAVITARQGRLRFDLPASSDPPGRGRGADPDEEGEGEPEIVPESEMRRRMKENIRAALEKADGKIYGDDGAAALLGIPPTTLASRIKSMGIER